MLSALLFAETTTIGVRYQEVHRGCLEREVRSIATPVGPIRFDRDARGPCAERGAEFEDCAQAAGEHNLRSKIARSRHEGVSSTRSPEL